MFWIKIGAGAISIILFLAVLYFLRNSGWLRFHYLYDWQDFLFQKPAQAKRVLKQWEEVKKRINSFYESDWKLAIIEADKLIDDIVKLMGAQGATLGERLNNLQEGAILNIDDLWQAHKVRNSIVHDPDFQLSHERAREVVGLYERVLKEFELM